MTSGSSLGYKTKIMRILSTLLSIILTLVLLPFQIIFWIFLFLRANFGRNSALKLELETRQIDNLNYKDGAISLKDGVVTLNSDDLTAEEKDAFYKEFAAELDGFPVQTNYVKHAYTLESVKDEHTCPRCAASTEQRLANFLYDAGSEIRVMYIPAGYFCLACPSVIVDIDLMKKGVANNFKFKALLGIDFGDDKDLNYFSSLNGEAVIYTSEDGQAVFLADPFEITAHPKLGKNRSQKRKQQKSQKSARKKNRSKK